MEVHFRDARLMELCNRSDKATRKWGSNAAGHLRRRLDDLQALSNLACAYQIPGKFHPLGGDRHGQYAVRLAGGLRLVLEPDQDPLPTRADDSCDLSRVQSICIVEVKDYHD